MEKRINKKVIATILAVVLVMGSIVGGTLAWLVAESEEVVNTFTYGDVNIDLDETDTGDGDDDPNTNEYEMMPGQDIAKDPKVTVKEGSEANWLFVKLEKSENFDEFLTYTMADGWNQLYDDQGNEVEGVYYRYQAEIADDGDAATVGDVTYSVLKDDQVTVLETVTKEQLNALDAGDEKDNYPTLTVSAYAVQYVGFEYVGTGDVADADPTETNPCALAAWNAALEQKAANEAATEETTNP